MNQTLSSIVFSRVSISLILLLWMPTRVEIHPMSGAAFLQPSLLFGKGCIGKLETVRRFVFGRISGFHPHLHIGLCQLEFYYLKMQQLIF